MVNEKRLLVNGKLHNGVMDIWIIGEKSHNLLKEMK